MMGNVKLFYKNKEEIKMIKVYPCGCIYWFNQVGDRGVGKTLSSERIIQLRNHNNFSNQLIFSKVEPNFREQHYNAMVFRYELLKDEESRDLTSYEERRIMDYISGLVEDAERYSIIHNLVTEDPLDAIIE